MSRHARQFLVKTVIYCAILALLFAILFPIAWMISTSFKTNQAIFNMPPEWVPLQPTLSGYATLFTAQSQFLTYFRNSLIVVGLTVISSLTFATLAGYSFSRFRFKWSNGVMLLLLATQMFPGVILLISGYILLKQLHLLNNYLGLVLAYTSFSLPFCVWMLKGFFDTIPRDYTARPGGGCIYRRLRAA